MNFLVKNPMVGVVCTDDALIQITLSLLINRPISCVESAYLLKMQLKRIVLRDTNLHLRTPSNRNIQEAVTKVDYAGYVTIGDNVNIINVARIKRRPLNGAFSTALKYCRKVFIPKRIGRDLRCW